MNRGTKLVAFGVATMINAAALGAVHVAMGHSVDRQSIGQPERVVVTARKHDLPMAETLAGQDCRDQQTL